MLLQMFFAFLLLFSYSCVVFANSATLTVRAVIQAANAPLVPLVNDVPTTSCFNFLNLTGRAESNVDIYVNDKYEVTADASGDFWLIFILDENVNTFVVKSFRNDTYSSEVTYTIGRGDCTSGSYPNTSGGGGGIPIAETVDYIEEKEIDEYIEESVTLGDDLEPLEEDLSDGSSSVRDAIAEGITTTYEDFDEDGISDIVELVLDLDVSTPDSDSDGINDAEEILFTHRVSTKEYDIDINLVDNYTFTCNELFVYGGVSPYDVDAEDISICMSGKDASVCFDIDVDMYGAFQELLRPSLKAGKYEAHLFLGDDLVKQYDVSCKDPDTTSDVLLSKVDVSKVYKQKGDRYKKRPFVISFTNRPTVQGVASVHDLVFLFWGQYDKAAAVHSLSMSDVNGYFEAMPSTELHTFFGFARETVYAYAYDRGVVTGVDVVDFYIFDLVIIFLELLLIVMVILLVRRLRKRA